MPRTPEPPRRFVRLLLAAAVLMLSLASCDMLFVGIFPADIAQMTGRIDLSAKIPATSGSSFNLSVLKLGGTEYVLLFSMDGFDPSLTHLFILDPTLAITGEYTLKYLNDFTPATTSFKGTTAVAHPSDGTIVVGNVVMVPNPPGLVVSGKLSGLQLGGDTVVGPGPGFLLWTNFGIGPADDLRYDQYDAAWNLNTTPSYPQVGKPVRFAGAFTDPEDTSNNTAMFVFEDGSNTQYFVQVPKDPDLAGAWPSLALLGNPDYLPFTKTDLDVETLQVTKTGIVAYDDSSNAWVRFLPSAPDQVTRMDVGRRSGSRKRAFSYSGGYYCVFDADTRLLTRYEDWW